MFRSIGITLEMIKFQHTLFALPFAFLAAFTAANGIPALRTMFWIVAAMVGARSAAMAFNRLADARIDAENPRTRTRALPAGLVTKSFVIVFTAASAALFVFAAWQLNRLAFFLSPLALVVVLGYSLTKRVTSLSHVFLGLSLAIAPVGAAIAVTGRFVPSSIILAAGVLVWTAGFDILYSLQDVEFDRERALFSIPAKLGPARALLIARTLHVLAIIAFAAFGIAGGFGWIYYLGTVAATALVVWQHSIISPNDISRIDAAFFTANGILSIVLFVCGATDILLR
ncbi:MAG: UbiA-like polyprenyltransferase [Thermoanaerobaculia bacterium]